MNNPEHLTYGIDKNKLRIGAALVGRDQHRARGVSCEERWVQARVEHAQRREGARLVVERQRADALRAARVRGSGRVLHLIGVAADVHQGGGTAAAEAADTPQPPAAAQHSRLVVS